MKKGHKKIARYLANSYPGLYKPGLSVCEEWKKECLKYGLEATEAFLDILENGPVIADYMAIVGLRALGYQAWLIDDTLGKPSYEVTNPQTKDKVIIISNDSYTDFDTMYNYYIRWLESD
jgi:hypothetical protein